MWKVYASSYHKQNRSMGASVKVSAFIAALFLAFLCGLFYDFWQDDIARVIKQEGAWHGRIRGGIDVADLCMIQESAHVETVTVNDELSGEDGVVVDITFDPVRAVREDLPSMAEALGLQQEAVSYHYQLLSLYFVRIPGDAYPRLVMPFYLAIIAAVCFSMILVIYNAFAFTMNARVHQLGILASVGATPMQIRVSLLEEAFRMTFWPILSGILSGVLVCRGVFGAMIKMAGQIVGGRSTAFRYPPSILVFTFAMSVFTVLMAAWIPAKRMSRMTPLEAIRGKEEAALVTRKRSPILSFLFGIEGELAGNFLKAQKKAFRTTTLSLSLSFLGFMLVQCFFTLSDISTEETYFARYQDAWDICVTMPDTGIGQVQDNDVAALRELSGVEDVAVYQKAETVCQMPKTRLSEELQALGGMEALTEGKTTPAEGLLAVKSPVVILDEESFSRYYEQIVMGKKGVSYDEQEPAVHEDMEGIIVINRVWDSLHSSFRNRSYIPFVQEERYIPILCEGAQKQETIEVPVLAYGEQPPVLREEYADYGLVLIMPQSYWEQMSASHPFVSWADEREADADLAGQDTYIRILLDDRQSLDRMTQLEQKMRRILGKTYTIESENRLLEKVRNDEMIRGYKTVLGGFCVLLAVIGVANVFSNTLGFLRLRKREVARYLSVGLTPGGVGKVFALEAMVIAVRPVLITVPLVAVLTGMMIKASYLEPIIFIKRAPVGEILFFVAVIFGAVAFAYYLGGKKVLGSNISEALREDAV